MKHNIFWRTMRRQPVRNGILLLLVALMSALLVSRGAEFIWIEQQVATTEKFYNSVGTVMAHDPTNYYIAEAVELIEDSHYIDHVSKNINTVATLGGMQSGMLMGDSHRLEREEKDGRGLTSSDMMLYGTVTQVTYLSPEASVNIGRTTNWGRLDALFGNAPDPSVQDGVDQGAWTVKVEIDYIEVGYADYVKPGETISMRCFLTEFPTYADQFEAPVEGQRYFFKAFYEYTDSYYDFLSLDTEEYLFMRSSPFFDGRWMIPVDEGEEIDWTAPENEQLHLERNAIEYLTRAVDLIGVADMYALPLFRNSTPMYYLTDGRWLTHEDHLSERPICVIPARLAESRNLQLGDSIDLTAYDFLFEELYLSGPNYLSDGSDHQSFSLDALEIVGIYAYAGEFVDYNNATSNTVYVPESLLPRAFDSFRPEVVSGEGAFGFILKSPRLQADFVDQYGDKLNEMGYRLTFVQNNFQAFYTSTRPLLSAAYTSMLVFLALYVLTSLLIGFLYTWPRRRDIAILQALGVPKSKAMWQLILSLFCYGGVASVVGCSAGWYWAMEKMAELIPLMRSEHELNTSLSAAWLIMIFALAITLLLASTWLFTWLWARHPVLDQFQDQRNKVVRVYATRDDNGSASTVASVPFDPSLTGLKGKHGRWRPLLRLTSRLTIGHPWKTLLCLLITVSFLISLGFMANSMRVNATEIDRLYQEVPIRMDIYKQMTTMGGAGGFIYPETIDALESSGYIKDSYLETAVVLQVGIPSKESDVETTEEDVFAITLRAPTNMAQMIEDYGLSVVYSEGWDNRSFRSFTVKRAVPMLLSETTIHAQQLEVGQYLNANGIRCLIVGTYRSSQSEFTDIIVGEDNLKMLVGEDFAYDRAEFTIDPAKNRELDALYALTDSLVETGGIQPLHFQYWDEELTSVVRPLEQSLQLLNILYPVVMVVSILIAIGLQVILLIQQLRTAALLRVLGVPVSQTGGVLTLLQLPAVVLGLVLGLGILLILYQTCDPVYAAMYLGGSLAGILLGLIRMARQQPLELLQVKE